MSNPSSSINNAKEHIFMAKSFLTPQSAREKRLIASYSGLAVFVSIVFGMIGSGGVGGGGGGSRPVFVVSNVYTYPNWKATYGSNRQMCAEMNQQSEYDSLLSQKWNITSTQQEERAVSAPNASGYTTGKCIGTLYVFSK